MKEMDTVSTVFGKEPINPDGKWKDVTVQESYYPTRLEYLAGKIVVGLLTGVSEKRYSKCVLDSVKLAQDMEVLLDKAQG